MIKAKCKYNIPALIGFAVFFLAILVLVTVKQGYYDYMITERLANYDSLYSQLFAKLGDFPSYIATPIGFLILFQGVKKGKSVHLYRFFKIGFLIGLLISNYIVMGWLMKGFFSEDLLHSGFYKIFGALVLSAINIFATSFISKDIMHKLMVFAIYFIVLMAVAQIFVGITKGLWSRLRFRNFLTPEITSGFTPWYQLHFNSDGREHLVREGSRQLKDAFKSFPSGHTCAAGVSFVIILLPDIFDKLKKYRVWFYIIPTVYTIIVAISRLVNEAHFLSDTLFGGTIVFVTAILFRHLIHKLYDFENTRVIRKNKDNTAEE